MTRRRLELNPVPRRLPVLLALTLVLLPALGSLDAAARGRKSDRVEDLINPLLSPRYALWLVGPITRMATAAEVAEFGRLPNDEAAAAFIEAFWQRRDPDPQFAGNGLRERFEERLPEADKRFTEAGVPGGRTVRGTLYVLYGPPQEEKFAIAEHPDDPPILVWNYPSDAPRGLDGKKPDRNYRFIKRGDLTELYTPNPRPVRPRPNDPG